MKICFPKIFTRTVAEVGHEYKCVNPPSTTPLYLYRKHYWDSKTGVDLKEKFYSPEGKLVKTVNQAKRTVLMKYKFPK